MAIRGDTAGTEKRYVLDMLPAQCNRILEIGCGDGRLTWQYAELADSIVAIDVTPDTLAEALRERPERFRESISILEASGVHLPFKSDSFDHALFSLSL
ncbi:MAG: class I SAM-dependent methyltransferase [Chloroflexi bacterium]|nr:class I SAM-dependent methyltransferase [Chloroflexota bacterium]